jgi:hypothetical protein
VEVGISDSDLGPDGKVSKEWTTKDGDRAIDKS